MSGSFVRETSRKDVFVIPAPALKNGAWIVAQVRSGIERRVSEAMQLRGYTQFLPTYKRSALRQRTTLEKPLFPGYVFCQYILNHPAPILAIPGVIRLVGTGRKPTPIEDEEMETI